jgi:NADH dehydrogenase [ubiquinone] 1 alpha subcomplex assembly factor 7
MDDPGLAHEQPAEAIRAAIAADGPIRFDRFMDLALYGPGGYYERRPVGPQGDFVTSPHVHPVFGELLARALRELWTHLGRPEPFRLVEIGAGDGTLARQLHQHLGDIPVRYTVIERSGRALRELRALSAVEVAPQIPVDPHVVLGHELLDNLPFRLVRGGSEILVGVAGGRLVEVQAPLDDALAGATHHPGEDEEERTVPNGAVALIDELARIIVHGYALFVDYGGDHGAGGPVHGYRNHRVVEDVLARPGTADITAGVDFGALAAAAVERGLHAFPTLTQFRTLAALGFQEWMREELATQGTLLNEGKGMDAVQRWAGRSRASILVSPDQLGRLRWFLLASKGLPRPSFMAGG